MANVLQTHDLRKRFTNGEAVIDAVDGVNLAVAAGEMLAIMGASGSGKSTVLHLLGGLDLPTSGDVVVDGKTLTDMGDRERTLFRRARIGVVFQSFNLLPTLSAIENVGLPLLIAGVRSRIATARACEMLARVDLSHRGNHRPDAMSGGEQQRVAIARALINDPAIILADEPTGNLDSRHAADIWALLRRLSSEEGRTIVAVTHESVYASYADRVVVLKDGRVVGEIETKGSRDASGVDDRYRQLAG